MTETALVTGGAGFIGSHLVDRLVDEGFRVVVVDNLSSGKRSNLHPSAEFQERDIRDRAVRDLVKEVAPSVVFHLAAQISVSVSARDPILDAEINVLGSLNVLEGVRQVRGAKFVFVSTGGAIYGEPEEMPVPETTPCAPASPYGTSKLAVEQYLGTYQRAYGLEYAVVRLGNIYGPRQDPHGEAGVIAIFSRAMLANDTVTIFGDGEDERDYVFVEDTVDGIFKAATSRTAGPYNIGTGMGTSVNQLARILWDLTGYRKEPVHAPPRPGDIHRIYLDAARARSELGWNPRVELDEGLQRTVAFFRSEQLHNNK